jgi:hypothetical protein
MICTTVMLGATAHAVLSGMRRCIAIGGRQVGYRFEGRYCIGWSENNQSFLLHLLRYNQ